MDDSPVVRSRSTRRQHVRPTVETPRDLPAPEPHLPLRRASAHSRFQARKGPVPKPILAPPNHPHHRVRGFNPSPVQPPPPHIENITASSEHNFAGREPKRPFKSAVGVLENQSVLQYADSPAFNTGDGRPPTSPLLPPPPRRSNSPTALNRGPGLKSSKSVGDGYPSLRHTGAGRQPGPSGRMTPDSLNARPSITTASDEIRDSFRSALTSHSSLGHTSSINTTQTSVSGRSSHTESFVKIHPPDYEETGLTDVDMSVEDAIGMYEDGFESGAGSARGSFDVRSIRSMDRSGKLTPDVRSVRSLQMERPATQPHPQFKTPSHASTPLKSQRPHAAHRRSQSASVLILGVPKNARPGAIASPGSGLQVPTVPADRERSSVQTATNQRPSEPTGPVPRDRYGFKKASHHITVEQYDAWNAGYTKHIERRTRKWHALMQSYGLTTDHPVRFPPKSDKIKRYVRKGIPPDFRGAVWFWYAGGPGKMAKDPGLYWELVEKVENGMLSETDREHIERDLNRTFPDNVKFKPDISTTADAQAGAGGGDQENIDPNASPESKKKPRQPIQEEEMPILRALRRVLQAFAIHNPNIGYCQSLNFLAGLLLIFLDEDEEKAFILLNIITSQHLPGTHGIALEGANIDIAVLMSCVKDTLPGVWDKLDDKGPQGLSSGIGARRLPTVSLATTAWFMSLFVGTLPIESVLRVWDCLFFEGSKTLFRIALAIFKAGESQILKVSDPMEIFQVVQTIPRGMLDVNGLMEVCYRRRGGFGSVSQGLIEGRRAEMRRRVKEGFRGDERDDEGALRRLRTKLRRGTARA